MPPLGRPNAYLCLSKISPHIALRIKKNIQTYKWQNAEFLS